MIFPASNLSTAAQPWGRVVEKSIGSLETLVATERVNNAARDAQAVVNIKRLDDSVVGLASTVASIKTITDNVFVTGTTEINGYNIKAGTINATSINAGELVGFTIKTAASGTRVEIAGTSATFYYGSDVAGKINGTNLFGSMNMAMTYANGDRGIYLEPQGGTWLGTNGALGIGTNGAYLRTSDFSKSLNMLSTGVDIVGPLGVSGTITGNGNINASTLTANSSAYIPSITSSLSVSGNLSTDGTLTRTALATGASTTCTITGSGNFVRTTSSERYKQDIQGLSVDYDELISLEPKRFRLKEEVIDYGSDARYYGGLIAEELNQLESLRDFVGYEKLEDGTIRPDSVYYGELTAALLSAVKHQDSLIKDLSARIIALENQ